MTSLPPAASPADWMALWLAAIRGRAAVAVARATRAEPAHQAATLSAIEAELEARRAFAEGVPAAWLRTRLGLSATEERVIWLLVAIELSDDIRAMVLALGDGRHHDPSLAVVQRVAYGDDDALIAWRELGPEGALVRLGLVHRTDGDAHAPEYRQTLRADRRVRGLVLGDRALSPELADVARPGGEALPLGEVIATNDAVARIAAAVAAPQPLVLVTGAPGSGRATALRAAARACGRAVIDVDARRLATTAPELRVQLRALVREARLLAAALLVRHLDTFGTGQPHAALVDVFESALRAAPELAVLATATQRPTTLRTPRPLITIELGALTGAQLDGLWARAVPTATADRLTELSTMYPLAPAVIHAVGVHLRAMGVLVADIGDVRDAITAVVDDRLAGLATRITVTQTWDDVWLPSDQFRQLSDLVDRIRGRRTVYEDWGFARKVGKGLGIAALLSGPPGTGKTMVAGLLAVELGVPVYRVDLAQMVSKWLGETEKHLSALFDAAEATRAILLFDEADSLFGKRTEVKSSNDRYANLEVNYLLQRLETFTGVCFLTTNHEGAIDDAFRRRLAFHVRFPLPDERERAELWRVMLPAAAPVADDVDFAVLGERMAMSGGYIRNAVLRAAFVAAEARTPIHMTHLWHAGIAECEAMGRIAPAAARP